MAQLEDTFHLHGYPFNVEFTMNQGIENCDLLLVTQQTTGSLLNLGPEGEEEVLQDDLRDILKPGEWEDEARRKLFEGFGRWPPSTVHLVVNNSLLNSGSLTRLYGMRLTAALYNGAARGQPVDSHVIICHTSVTCERHSLVCIYTT